MNNEKENKKKDKPPSRIKYEKNNPVFSIRMPQEWHDELKTLMEDTGLSRKDFLAVALEKQTLNYEELREKLVNDGIEIGETMMRVKMNCYDCGKDWKVLLNSSVLENIYEHSKRTHFFYCPDCKKNYQK